MVDGAVLVVDATEGVMSQTKFVVSRALRQGLKIVVVLNKADRDSARLNGEVGLRFRSLAPPLTFFLYPSPSLGRLSWS